MTGWFFLGKQLRTRWCDKIPLTTISFLISLDFNKTENAAYNVTLCPEDYSVSENIKDFFFFYTALSGDSFEKC